MGAGSEPSRRPNAAEVGQQTALAFELRLEGLSYRVIADRLGVSVSTAHGRVEQYLREHIDPAAEELRRLELERLDELWRRAWEVMCRQHVVTQHGQVVRRQVGVERHPDGIEKLDPDGKPIPLWEEVPDDGPVLAAIDRLLRLSERRSRLLGLDLPVRVDATVHQVDPADLALMQLIREAEARNQATEARLRGLPGGTATDDEEGTGR